MSGEFNVEFIGFLSPLTARNAMFEKEKSVKSPEIPPRSSGVLFVGGLAASYFTGWVLIWRCIRQATVHLTKKIYYFFEQNRFSCNLLCTLFTRRIAHMQKGAFQNIQEPFQKSNSNFTSLRGALDKVASPPRQSGTTGLLLRPSSHTCLHAAPVHLRRLHGDPPETQALERRCRARREFR
jgi:hypothetical protein